MRDDEDDFQHDARAGMPNVSTKSSPEDVKREVEKLIKRNEQDLHTSFKDSTKGGNFFGLKLPPYIAPLVNVAYDVFIVPVSTIGSSFAYNKGVRIAEHLKISGKNAHNFGIGAEATIRWGIIASKPLIGFMAANKNYISARRALYKEFQPVIESNKIDYKNNEVVKTAFDHLHDDYAFSLKRLIPSLLSFGVQVPYALEQQKEIKSKRAAQFEGLGDIGKTIQEKVKTALGGLKDKMEVNSAVADFIEAEKIKHIRNNKNRRGYDNEILSPKELADDFERRVGRSLRAEYLNPHKSVTSTETKPAGSFTASQQYQMLLTAVSVSSEGISTAINESRSKYAKVNSWEMIKHLKEEMETHYGESSRSNRSGRKHERTADGISISVIDGGRSEGRGRRSEELSLKAYIIEVFQQLERDRGRPELGAAMLEQLIPAVDKIAEYIADGRLKADALVSLAGDNKIIQHKSSGGKIFANSEQVQKELDALVPTLGSKEKVTKDELLAAHSNPAEIKKVIQNNLATMTGEIRDVFASFFPVDFLVGEHIKKADAIEMHKRGHALLYKAVAGGVITLAAKVGTEDPELVKKELCLSSEQLKAITDLAAELEQGNWKALETAVDGADKTVLAATRTAGLEMDAKGKAPWAEWVKKGEELYKEISENKKTEETQKDEDISQRARIHEKHDKVDDDAYEQRHAHRHKKSEGSHVQKFANDDSKGLMKSAAARVKQREAKNPHEGLSRYE